jgi:hypothetical protein
MLSIRRIERGRFFVLLSSLLLIVMACSPPAGLPFIGGAQPTPTLAVEALATATLAVEAVETEGLETPESPEATETPEPLATPTETLEAEMAPPSPVVTTTVAIAPPEATVIAPPLPGPAGLGFTAYSDPEYGFSLSYPQDWVFDSPRAGTVAFAPSGEALIQSAGAFFGLDAVTWNGDTAREVMGDYLDHMAQIGPEVETTDLKEVVVGNAMGVGVDLRSVNETTDEATQGFALGAVAGGRGYVVVAAALEKDWPRLSTIFTGMVDSIEFVGGEMPEIPSVTGSPEPGTPMPSPTPGGGEQPGPEETPVGTPVPPGEALSLQVLVAGMSPGFVRVTLSNRSGQNWYVDDLDFAGGVLNLEVVDPATGLRVSRVLPVTPAEPATRLLPPGEALVVDIKLAEAYALANLDTYKIVAVYQSGRNAAGQQPFWEGTLTSAPVDVFVP